MECHNGQCKGTVCKNGQCHEVSFAAKDKMVKKMPAEQNEYIVEVPQNGDGPAQPEALTKEEFQRILQKIKEHMEKNGMKGDVVVKIVPMGGKKPMPKQEAEDAGPPPPPSFAPKNSLASKKK